MTGENKVNVQRGTEAREPKRLGGLWRDEE